MVSNAARPGLAGTTRHLHVPDTPASPRGAERVSILEVIGSAGTFVRSVRTIRDAATDIAVVDGGRVERGRPAALIRDDDLYRELHDRLFGTTTARGRQMTETKGETT